MGKLSLDIDLTSTLANKKDLLKNGTGYFDFAVWPENIDAGVFDLWAVNVLNSIVSETNKDTASKVNCAGASFSLKQGVMEQKVLFVDTSKMQIEGIADIDFKRRKVKLYVEPKAKKPEFFSLATPVKVKGDFDDFYIGVNPASLASSVVQFVVSPVLVPFHRLFSTDAPVDGEVACELAWQLRNEERIETRREKILKFFNMKQ